MSDRGGGGYDPLFVTPKVAPKPAPNGKQVQLFKMRRNFARRSIRFLSIIMQAAKWYLSCVDDDKCLVLSCFEG